MNNGLRRRLQWLFPVEREVYKSWRCFIVTDDEGSSGRECVRCGSHVRMGDVGFSTRRRGSFFKDVKSHAIHRRCVPTAQFETAGLPARKIRRSGT